MKKLLTIISSHRAPFRLALAMIGASVGLVCLSGCAGEDRPVDNTAMLPESQRVSTVPWNPPEKWEQQGQLGQIASDPRFANH